MKFTFSEREYEDWLCEYLDDDYDPPWKRRIFKVLRDYIYHEGQTWRMMRQVSIGNGFADIVLRGTKQVFVIELKAVKADGEALAQVMTYANRLKLLFNDASQEIELRKFIIAPEFSEKLIKSSINFNSLHLIKCIPSCEHKEVFGYDNRDLTKHERLLTTCFDKHSAKEKEEVENSA